jgi:hypothetical protein
MDLLARFHFRILTFAAVVTLITPARAAIVWAENINGDLSSNPAAPTFVDLLPGSNIVNGVVFTGSDTRDYITFTIAPGENLVSLRLLAYDDLGTGTPNDGNRGFHAINLGTTSFIPDGTTISSFLGGNHLDPTIGADLLANLATAPLGGTGFTVPLGPGTYTYLVQQTGPQQSAYSIEFNVTPEPSGLLLVIAGFGALAGRRRRSRTSTR